MLRHVSSGLYLEGVRIVVKMLRRSYTYEKPECFAKKWYFSKRVLRSSSDAKRPAKFVIRYDEPITLLRSKPKQSITLSRLRPNVDGIADMTLLRVMAGITNPHSSQVRIPLVLK
ncbi:hypothetical protein PCASD_17317 [Puccinia coronata f. sp. avenae]|uniref:Uncharacterized protein n=1 Tax=Puccinia coronata f. sp. avenae TaxID=200324 RepID=A0A2N5U2I4_9BASI|nr:hypothetical protein PCASD_17317 [Puccinia coronata f. sp. avenae]